MSSNAGRYSWFVHENFSYFRTTSAHCYLEKKEHQEDNVSIATKLPHSTFLFTLIVSFLATSGILQPIKRLTKITSYIRTVNSSNVPSRLEFALMAVTLWLLVVWQSRSGVIIIFVLLKQKSSVLLENWMQNKLKFICRTNSSGLDFAVRDISKMEKKNKIK